MRTRGGSTKYRAIRLETGNFSWAGESVTKKTRVLDVVYNASNNELVRTKTIVKNAIVLIDATPFRTWFETHYRMRVVKNAAGSAVEAFTPEAGAGSKKVVKKFEERAKDVKEVRAGVGVWGAHSARGLCIFAWKCILLACPVTLLTPPPPRVCARSTPASRTSSPRAACLRACRRALASPGAATGTSSRAQSWRSTRSSLPSASASKRLPTREWVAGGGGPVGPSGGSRY